MQESYQVLLVESDRSTRSAMMRWLERSPLPLQVKAVGLPQAASHHLRSRAYDLLLVGIPPDPASLESTYALGAIAPQVPCLVLGHLDQYPALMAALRHGACGYLIYDRIDMDLLDTSLRSALNLDLAILPSSHPASLPPDIPYHYCIDHHLQVITDSLPGVIFQYHLTVDGSERFDFISEGIETLFGYSAEMMRADVNRLWSVILPEDAPGLWQAIGASRKSLTPMKHEFRIQARDGSLRWVQARAKPIAQLDGTITWYGMFFDVSDRHQLEEQWQRDHLALKQTKEQFEAIASNLPGTVIRYLLRPDGTEQLLYANSNCRELWELEVDQAKHDLTLVWQQVHPDDLAAMRASILQSAETLTLWHYEWRITTPSGKQKWMEATGRPLRQPNGDTIWDTVILDISDRKVAEIALQTLESAHRGLIEAIPDLLITMTADGTYTKVKRGGEVEMLGAERVVPGISIFDVLPADFAEQRMQYVHQALASQTAQRYSYDIVVNGTLRHEDAQIVPINGTEVLVIVRDITSQVQANRELQHQQEFLRQVIDSLDCLVFVKNADGRFLAANRAVADVCGVAVDELIGKLESEVCLYNPVKLEEVLDTNRRVMRMECSYQIPHELITHFDGSEHWYQTTLRPFYSSSGEVRGIIGVSVNISSRRQLEFALQQQMNQAILASQITDAIRHSLDPTVMFQTAADLLGHTFDASRCLMLQYFDAPPRLIFAAEYRTPGQTSMLEATIPVTTNPHACHVMSMDQALASPNVYTDPLLRDQAALCRQFDIRSMLVVRTSYQGVPNGAIALQQCDRYRYWSATDIELLETVAAQMGVAIAHANLLRQERQQQQELQTKNIDLEQAKAAAESANQVKSKFLSHMTHELRTPLNIILGYVQIMQRDQALAGTYQSTLETIFASGQHLLSLINDVLDFSRLEAGHMTLERRAVNLVELVTTLNQMFQTQATQKGLQFFVEVTPHVPAVVMTDGKKLRQILINLISNALKFTHQGMVALRISYRRAYHSEQDGTLCFEVMDTGVGIDPAEQEAIFQPFVQSQKVDKSIRGSGLGLSIIREFLHLMGGQISVASTPDQGSTFTVTLPIQVEQGTTSEPLFESQVSHKLRDVLSLAICRVLLIDDQVTQRQTLARTLIASGFSVHEVDNWEEAIAMSQTCPYHVVLAHLRHPQDQCWTPIQRDCLGQPVPTLAALVPTDLSPEQKQAIASQYDVVLRPPLRDTDLLHLLERVYDLTSSAPQWPTAIAPQTGQLPVAPDQIAGMSPQWMKTAIHTALRCDDKTLKRLVAEIPNPAVQEALLRQIDNFAFEVIVALVEDSMRMMEAPLER